MSIAFQKGGQPTVLLNGFICRNSRPCALRIRQSKPLPVARWESEANQW
jgi:hypothetical protein